MAKDVLAITHQMREVGGRRYAQHPDGVLPGPPPSPVGTINLISTALTIQTGQQGQVVVARAGGSAGAIAVDWAVTGATPASGTLAWADRDATNKTATITAGAVGAGAITLSNARRTDSGSPAPGLGTSSGVITITAQPAPVWSLPSTISIQAGGSVGIRQYALNSEGWTLNVTGLAEGLAYNAAEEAIEAPGAASSSTATFTMSREGDADIVATTTVTNAGVPVASLGTITIVAPSASSFIHDAAEGYAIEFRVTRSGATSGAGTVAVDWAIEGFTTEIQSGTLTWTGNSSHNITTRIPFHGEATKQGQIVLSNPRRTDGGEGIPAINVGTRPLTCRAAVPGDMSASVEEAHYSDIKGIGGWPTIRAYPGRPFYVRAKRGERAGCAIDWASSGITTTPASGTIEFTFAEQSYFTKAVPVTATAAGTGAITLSNPRRTDGGLNAPTLSVPTIPVEVLSGSPPAWLLPDGHYIPAKMPMKVIHPRSFPTFDETTDEARHKNAYPGLPYSIPVSVQGGAYPFHYELVEGPPGMTIGETVDQEDYGEVRWANPTLGEHTVRVRITDQELQIRSVQYTLSVNTERFIFVDPSVETSGDGTIGSPLKLFSELHGGFYPKRNTWPDSPYSNPGVSTYGRKIVYLRAGVHAVADIPTPWLEFTADRPHVLLGYPGEHVELDSRHGQIRINQPDFFVGGLLVRHSPILNLLWGGHWSETSRTSGTNSSIYAYDNSWEMSNSSRSFQCDALADRLTIFDAVVAESYTRSNGYTLHPSSTAGGNSAFIQGNSLRGLNPETKSFQWREYITFWNVGYRGARSQFCNMYTFFYGVAEKMHTLPDEPGELPMDPLFRLVFAKSTNDFWSYRRFRATLHPQATGPSDSGAMYIQMSNTHHHTRPIRQEACYNLLHSVGVNDGIMFKYNQGAGGNDTNLDGNKTWSYRNTFIGRQMGYNRFYTINFENNVQLISTVEFTGQPYPESRAMAEVYVFDAGITGLPGNWTDYLDSNYLLKAPYRAANVGRMGHEISGGE